MSSNELSIKFWGVRGSYPVPGKRANHFGGNTSCLEIRANEHIIILDAGTGIINLGNKLVEEMKQNGNSDKNPMNIHIFFSHTHHDHIQGLPFFAPAYLENCTLNFFGPKSFSHGLHDILANTMESHFSPIELDELNSKINIHNINESDIFSFSKNKPNPTITRRNGGGEMKLEDLVVSLMRNYAHPKIGTFVIKAQTKGKSIVYATDTEGYIGGDTRLIDFSQNANLLIHDAQYDVHQYSQMQGFGHSTYEMAAEVATKANVENLVLFHHDPGHDDGTLAEMETKAKDCFANTAMAYEGLKLMY